MNSSVIELKAVQAVSVVVDDTTLSVEVSDGRSLSVPLAWYPRLLHANEARAQHLAFNWKRTGHSLGTA
jgi:hypothetical protein